MVAGYRWKITRDRIDAGRAVGTEGPHNAPPWEALEAVPGSEHFRMLDDDGEVYYYGQIHYAPGYEGSVFAPEVGFEPLDDFGTPNAGCVRIEYKNKAGDWEVL